MRGLDQTCKQMAIAVVLVSGALVSAPTVASAQFGIPGINITPFIHGYGGSGRSSSRHSKASTPSKRDSSDKDASNQDASDQDVKTDSKTARRQTSAPAPRDTSQAVANDTPPSIKSVPSKSSSDEPTFSPSR